MRTRDSKEDMMWYTFRTAVSVAESGQKQGTWGADLSVTMSNTAPNFDVCPSALAA